MVGGFALIAWPAQHGVSGVKTFIVNHDDVVERRDVERGEKVANGVTVRSGLEGGERAIVLSSKGATPGAQVEAVPFHEGGLTQLVTP